MILQWLAHDVRELIKDGKEELRLVDSDEGEDSNNIIDGKPIILFSGVRKELSDSEFLDWMSFIEKVGSEDYFCEKGVDKTDKYSIYNLLVIFPCKNFIAYYKCLFNFIRGASLDDETCEYLYDSIIAVKTQEVSLSNISKNISKMINFELIKIATADGKEILFPVTDDARLVKEAEPKTYDSIARNTAHNIRQQIRQRKPGRMMVESLNEKMQQILDLDE